MNNPYVKTLEPVWRNLNNVSVNEDKLQELIKEMKLKHERGELSVPAWDVPNVQPPMDCRPAEWINYICWLNTVNFAFTNFQPPYNKFTIEYPEGVQWRGAFALGASFMRALQEGIVVFDSEYMKDISLNDVRHIFRSVDDAHQIPMIRERWKTFHEVGRVLLKKYNGAWIKLFIDAGWRAFNGGRGIVEQLVVNFPSFRDTRSYNGLCLEFHKRAQLLVMEYHGRAVNSGFRMPEIRDIGDIGPIADYEVPKALKFLGVIEYSRQMEDAIQNHRIIPAGDPLEVENRLAMSYAMKILCDEAGINMAQADFYIWNMGRSSKEPHILVPTTNY